jgi:ABC-type uncharacterized transport system permease subunit
MTTFLYVASTICWAAIFVMWLYAPTAGAVFFLPLVFIAIVCMALGHIIGIIRAIAIRQGAIAEKPAPKAKVEAESKRSKPSDWTS